jgi:hypothetical protein
VIQFEIGAAIIGRRPGEQSFGYLDGFFQPLVPFEKAWPAFADDMLVQPFACT